MAATCVRARGSRRPRAAVPWPGGHSRGSLFRRLRSGPTRHLSSPRSGRAEGTATAWEVRALRLRRAVTTDGFACELFTSGLGHPEDAAGRGARDAGGSMRLRRGTMTRPFTHPPRHLLEPSERLAAALAALTASGSIAAALVVVFLDASSAVWPVPEPDVAESLALCDRESVREAPGQCKRDVVAAHLEAHKRPVLMTQH